MKKSYAIRSTCGLCYTGCGILVHMADGKPVKIEGDPDSPVNKGALCEKAMASLQYLYHPDRLRTPLRRSGGRGGGQWEKISWNKALETIGEKFNRIKQESGPEAVAFIQGAAKGFQDTYLCRFANVFGSPNFVSQGYVCFLPRKFGSLVTLGFAPCPDFDYPPRCIIVWASHKPKIAEYLQILEAKKKGAKLIVIDPRRTELVRRADRWLRVRPGSDLALALGMINVIIEEELYDKTFVKEWTVGFDKLKEHIRKYPLKKVEEITWVDRHIIEDAARMYATTKPGCIQMGNAFEHNINSFQTVRAISILKGLAGNLGMPGGEVLRLPLSITDKYAPELTLENLLPEGKKRLRLGSENHFLPLYKHTQAPSVIRAMVKQKPYPVRGAYVQGANPILTYPNAKNTYKAFTNLDFLVVSEHFMTPTAALADIVLPSATYLEFDSIVYPPYYPIAQVQQKVAEVDECWSDFKIINTLAGKMGLDKFFWDNEWGFLNLILKSVNMDFDGFRKIDALAGEKAFDHYRSDGFGTPSGKVELFSDQLKELGFEPLPVYREPPETPYSDTDMVREYPLVLTSWKSEYYRHSGGRQIKNLRKSHPEPVVHVHPQTASGLGISEGDWVIVATKRGSIRQKAVFNEDIDSRVVGVDYAWWFPEKGTGEQYGWAESNINILTSDRPPFSRELGSANLRGFLCKIEKEDSPRR